MNNNKFLQISRYPTNEVINIVINIDLYPYIVVCGFRLNLNFKTLFSWKLLVFEQIFNEKKKKKKKKKKK